MDSPFERLCFNSESANLSLPGRGFAQGSWNPNPRTCCNTDMSRSTGFGVICSHVKFSLARFAALCSSLDPRTGSIVGLVAAATNQRSRPPVPRRASIWQLGGDMWQLWRIFVCACSAEDVSLFQACATWMLPGWQAFLWAHLDCAGLRALLHGRLWCGGQTWGGERVKMLSCTHVWG